ncbi:Short-chain dehydrogenase/reductase SDR? [uncultured Synechococcales cyanobacterium]|uniref:Short-chain dehydrogenase/reductase SDR n=1 Tax=uncultured Synechococcales cyanobacterium TaxID=1936017 RepID=A0A6J4VYV0_9CYAN|nr:Short-chain dehydrogenase/reductase SDR? [uncultured Synechococcales cyanobacterium]
MAATARNPDRLKDLVEQFGDQILRLRLDVIDRTSVQAAVQAAHAHFGQLDVIVNNAGYGLFGAIEEVSEVDVNEIIVRPIGQSG